MVKFKYNMGKSFGDYGIPQLDINTSMISNRLCHNISTMPSTLRKFMIHCIINMISSNNKVVVICMKGDTEKLRDIIYRTLLRQNKVLPKSSSLLQVVEFSDTLSLLELMDYRNQKIVGFFIDFTSIKDLSVIPKNFWKVIKRFSHSYSCYVQINTTVSIGYRNKLISGNMEDLTNSNNCYMYNISDDCNFITTNKKISKSKSDITFYNIKRKDHPLLAYPIILKINRYKGSFLYKGSKQLGFYKK